MSTDRAGSEAIDRVSLWSTLRNPLLLVAGVTIAGIHAPRDERDAERGLHRPLCDRARPPRGSRFRPSGRGRVRGGHSPAGGRVRGELRVRALGRHRRSRSSRRRSGCLASFGWARALGRRWAARRIRGRLARADRFLAANPFVSTLVLRLLPVGNSLALNLLAGVSAVPALPFLAASVIGFIPQTIIFALLGGGIRVARGWQIGIAAGLFVSSALGGLWLLRRQRQLAAIAIESGEAAAVSRPSSMHVEKSRWMAKPRRLDQAGGCDPDGMQAALQFPLPKGQELAQDRVARRDVQLLPDIGLQEARMVGHVIEDLSRRQVIILELLAKRHADPLSMGTSASL